MDETLHEGFSVGAFSAVWSDSRICLKCMVGTHSVASKNGSRSFFLESEYLK
jgi:hypothetical protein